MSEYRSSPLADRLRQDWLKYLARSQHWDRLVRDFDSSSSEFVQCAYARALVDKRLWSQAMQEAEKLWLHGRSRPRECDPVFDAWRSRDMLTPDLAWQRIDMAIGQGQASLARYLGRYLPREDQSWLDLWLQVLSRPSAVLNLDWSQKTHPVAQKIFFQGMSGLIREDAQKALAHWRALEEKQDLSSMDTLPVKEQLALYLALRKHPEALDFFKSLSSEDMSPRLKEWHVRNALYRQEWLEALSALDRLDHGRKNSPRWLYWRARALEETGLVHEAAFVYQQILGRQNYFSLLAADRLGKPYRMEHRAVSAPGADILEVRSDQGVLRAMELFHLGRMTDARREWNTALAGKSREYIRAAAILAHDLGWHDRAIIAAANAGEFDDLILRFPTSYSELISNYSRIRGLEPSWVFAVARQESMFMADVGSPAGALGVMQIMPATGRLVASLMGERFQSSFALLCPETNIRFGTFYLKKRLDELQGNPVLATAAYNAGAHRVRGWLHDEGAMAADIWVENIPFAETRDYVEKVFSYKVIYEKRLGRQPERVSSFMPHIFGRQVYLSGTAEN